MRYACPACGQRLRDGQQLALGRLYVRKTYLCQDPACPIVSITIKRRREG